MSFALISIKVHRKKNIFSFGPASASNKIYVRVWIFRKEGKQVAPFVPKTEQRDKLDGGIIKLQQIK